MDAHHLFEQPPKSYNWWPHCDFAFRGNRGLHIDQILVSAGLAGVVTACAFDKGPRDNGRPSDHAQVVVELVA